MHRTFHVTRLAVGAESSATRFIAAKFGVGLRLLATWAAMIRLLDQIHLAISLIALALILSMARLARGCKT